jgi:hypothetical protein
MFEPGKIVAKRRAKLSSTRILARDEGAGAAIQLLGTLEPARIFREDAEIIP